MDPGHIVKRNSRSARDAALALENIVDNIIGHAMMLPDLADCDPGHLRLVSKLWNTSADACIWEELYMCDPGHVYGTGIGTPFDLAAMLKRRPSLCLYLKSANFEMAGPRLPFRLDLLSRAENLRYLSVSGLDLLAAHHATLPLYLPKLQHMRFDVQPKQTYARHVRRQIKDFLQSLGNIDEVTVFTAPFQGDFFPWSSYDLPNLLDGIVPPEAGIAPRISAFGLLLSPITRCSKRNLDALLKTFHRLRYFTLALPPEINIDQVLDTFPDSIETMNVRCGNQTLRGILEGLANPEKLPSLRTTPRLEVHGIEETDVIGVERDLVDRALVGLSRRADFTDLQNAKRLLYDLVLDKEDARSVESTGTSARRAVRKDP